MENIFVLLLASGTGSRFGASMPKQYTKLANSKSILETSLETFSANLPQAKITLLISPCDNFFKDLELEQKYKFELAHGGASRAESCLNGLNAIKRQVDFNSWVLVHDAARCLLHSKDLLNLIHALQDDDLGGILAQPLTDTIKQAKNDNKIQTTLDRNLLWAAQTPQMFRYGILKQSLENALQQNLEITDEASCLELAGFSPKLVAATEQNFKITFQQDVELANFILQNRQKA